jgi:hypothetical protein
MAAAPSATLFKYILQKMSIRFYNFILATELEERKWGATLKYLRRFKGGNTS